jgi:Tfp pilus assembly protein PilW
MILRKIRNDLSGLTIIELMIALAIMLLVLAIGFNFFFLTLKAYETGENLSEVQFDVRMAADFITRELRYVNSISLTDDTLANSIDTSILNNNYPSVMGVSFKIEQSGAHFIVNYVITGNNSKLNNDYILESNVLLNNINSVSTGTGLSIYYE